MCVALPVRLLHCGLPSGDCHSFAVLHFGTDVHETGGILTPSENPVEVIFFL